jgi:hypothetical protein
MLAKLEAVDVLGAHGGEVLQKTSYDSRVYVGFP